jgi:hypothetical protein
MNNLCAAGEVRCEDCTAGRDGRRAKRSQPAGLTADVLRAAGIDPAQAAEYLPNL